MYYSYFIVHLVGTFELCDLLEQLACPSCNKKEIKCIKATGVHGVTEGAMKYIILCNHCGYNFP
jgi:transcription elongation factor Elf1